ncbi:MAG: M28 family peptidase, partial [Anaerolineaceae bacterium]
GGIILWRTQYTVKGKAQFQGSAAYLDVVTQVNFGPRIPGSDAHQREIEWIRSETEKAGWTVEVQETELSGKPIQNVIAKRGEGEPFIILGAHYDSRLYADQDPDPLKQNLPVPGANDGASGVAVLTELARVLPEDFPGEIWLVFFDAEDNGKISGWDWIMGSSVFVDRLEQMPNAVVIVDMIGDADLNVYREGNSDITLMNTIWKQAKTLGYGDKIIDQEKYFMIDDHTPFRTKGIPAVDMIDFDYPYWHTVSDTADKVSPESLEVVGRTLQAWIKSLE